MYSTAWFGDRYRMRGPVLLINCALCIIGLPMMGFATDSATRYAGVFLTVGGVNANIPASMAYQANNVRGQWTRALSSATLVGFGGIGGIAGSLVFRDQDAPLYRPGIWAAIAYVPSPLLCALPLLTAANSCNLLIILIVFALSVWFWWCNKQANRGKRVMEDSAEFRYTI
jgi:hypothetical protein